MHTNLNLSVGESISFPTFDSSARMSEDEFEQELQRNKENIDPLQLRNLTSQHFSHQSPLQQKLKDVSFFSSDFENDNSRKQFCKLVGEVVPMLKLSPEKKKRKESPQKKKQPYKKCRTARTGMTMFQMVSATDTPEKVVAFLQDHGCLPKEKKCPDCSAPMKLVQRTDKVDANQFRCWKRHSDGTRCNKKIALTSESFFFNMHLGLFAALWLLWGFCEGMCNDWFIRHLGLSSSTVVDWLNFCREVCMVCIESKSRQIGGFGYIVEIDESKFVKRKYHKGKPRKCKDWILGGICRETGECFMRIVKNRNKDTLLKYIQMYVKPGTVIITDCWAAYKDLKELEGMEYTHYTVNHSETYVDAVTGAHTNTIEGTWAHCKRACPKLGLRSNFLDGYICRFIWFKLTKSLGKDPFFFLLECISEQYQIKNSPLRNLADTFTNSTSSTIDI